MKFDYSSAIVQFTSDETQTTVYRPVLPVRATGPAGAVHLRAIVDSGADCTIFPLELAEALGIQLQLDEPVFISGIEGSEVPFYAGEVDLEIEHHGTLATWRTKLLFGAFENFLLGQLGFFEFFTVSFDYDGRKFEVLPNSRLAGN